MAIGKNRELYKRFAKEFDSQGRYIVEKRTTTFRTVYLVTDKSWNGAYAIVDKDEDGVEYVIEDKSFYSSDIEKLNELTAYVEGRGE